MEMNFFHGGQDLAELNQVKIFLSFFFLCLHISSGFVCFALICVWKHENILLAL